MNYATHALVLCVFTVLLTSGNAAVTRKHSPTVDVQAYSPALRVMHPRSHITSHLFPGLRSRSRFFHRTHGKYAGFFPRFFQRPYPYTLTTAVTGNPDYWCGDINDPHDAEKCHKPCPDGDPNTCGEGMMCYSGITSCEVQPSPSPSPSPPAQPKYCVAGFDGPCQDDAGCVFHHGNPSFEFNCLQHCTSDDECTQAGFNSCAEIAEEISSSCCVFYGVDCWIEGLLKPQQA